jgi:peptide deformylase
VEQLKSDPIMYNHKSYSLVTKLERATNLIPDTQTQSSLNQFTQALYRTAKRLRIPFVTANMVGKPFHVISLQSFGLVSRTSRALINPKLIACSAETQKVEETFIYNPEQSVIKIRPLKIKIQYSTRSKKIVTETFTGRFAAYVMQAIEVLYALPLDSTPPNPSEVAARLKLKYPDHSF